MRWPAWLGVGERRWKKSPDEEVQPPKTAWDFLQLLIVPGILVVIALAFNASQASRERSREDRRIRQDRALAEDTRQDAVLDAYLAKMSGLILDRALTSAESDSAVRQVARTATLTTLRRLDGSRKGEVVRFLYEAGLLRRTPSRTEALTLAGADLRRVNLVGADFSPASGKGRVVLSGGLRGARFDYANLKHVTFDRFAGAELRAASFDNALIYDSSFESVDLRGASFKEARLSKVSFLHSDLRGTVFDDAEVFGGTTFRATCLGKASFVGARFNVGAFHEGLETTFSLAKGQDVDFSDAMNLSSIRLSDEVTNVRFDGAEGRPQRAPRPSSFDEALCF
jgi:uncharacterized protein YjbI with pentapeptide repeats